MSGMRRASRSPHGPVAIVTSPWIVVGAGVVVMVVLLFVALGAYRGRSPAPDGARPPALPVPSAVVAAPTGPTSVPSPLPALPGISGRASGLPPSGAVGSGVPSAAPTVGGSGRPTATVSPSRASSGQPAMTGRYRVVQSFDGGFIGEVAMVNASARSRGWTVLVEFSGGRLVTAWVEGVPQGTIRESGDGFTYVSGVDVPPGGSVSLRFHWERASSNPRRCTVDGERCGGL